MGRPRRTVLVTSRWVASAAVMAAMATGAAAASEDGPAGPAGGTSVSAAGHAAEELQRGVDLRKA
ncbi:hypothetical protein [Nocardioides zeae]|uniref:Uncharacterized protein n=1 Tax=Nocardioides zeae TaxID=1457234 RepID=A0AAJ1U7W9_9ACTN|nr:hypothetical protein [Nocardioides zeae]MDQ1105797.1 hypothetical protein [Nocardioides zeae]